MTGVCQPHDFARGGRHCRFVITDDVAKQHHLGQGAALAFGRVADGTQIALVQVLETGEQGTARASRAVQVILDLDDRRDRIAGLPEKLQTHCARVAWHAVKHPARRRDQAVAPLFLDTGKACQELVGHVLAKPRLAKAHAIDLDDLAAQQALACGMRAVEPLEFEANQPRLVNLAKVVIQPGDVKPVAIGIHHAPPGEVIQGGAPQHRFLAAGVHGDVAAHTRSLGRGRIDSEYVTRVLGRLGDPLGDDPGTGPHRGDRGLHARQRANLDRTELVELFGIDDHRFPGQGDRAARVAGTAATRNDREAEFDATAHQAGDLVLGIRGQDDKGILDTPIGCISDMGNARKPVELDVVAGGQAAENPIDAPAQLRRLFKRVFEGRDRGMRPAQQAGDFFVAARVIGHATLVDLAQAVPQGLDQQSPTPGIIEQVILQVRIALDNPDVAQDLVEHLGRTARATFAAQVRKQPPGIVAQQAADHLAIGKRGVVIGDFAQTRVRLRRHGRGEKMAG